MNAEFAAFGEILWDCLPSGRHAGGAPFNVAAHLAQLGASAALLSAVGADALGDEILSVARDKGVNAEFVTRARAGLATGTVMATIDARGNATYEIVQPAAWDEIEIPAEALPLIGQSRAVVFGSLAVRSSHNLGELHRLLAIEGPLRFFDVNFRQPFVNPSLVIELAKRADVLKLNDDELGRLTSWLRTGELRGDTPGSMVGLTQACSALADATETSRICVTRGSAGAVFWENGEITSAPAPRIEVKDTVGAGDAFMAGLMIGLTRGVEPAAVLERACRLGGYVASHDGATPLLPPELRSIFTMP